MDDKPEEVPDRRAEWQTPSVRGIETNRAEVAPFLGVGDNAFQPS